MILVKLKARQIVNLEKSSRFVAIGFDKTSLKPFLVIDGLGVQVIDDLTFEELEAVFKPLSSKFIDLSRGDKSSI